jgi:hypothetical protein
VTTPPLKDSRHSLHSRARIWPESNCYVDAWIGLLHTLDLDPLPMLLCALDSRFELDQWTFCKPSAFELATLYGVRVEELNIWRNTREHVQRQVSAGRVVLLETDSYFLPDTEGTSYRLEHSKSTIGITRMSSDRRELQYLHNVGAFSLTGADFDGVFDTGVTAAALPPFAEFADVAGATMLDLSTLRDRAVMLAQRRLSSSGAFDTVPNAFHTWMRYADDHLDGLAAGDLTHFHKWAFATVRQAGAMSDLLSRWCRWMSPNDGWLRAATFFEEVARAMAAQQFRLARVPGGGRHPDLAATLAQCAPLWTEAHALVRAGMEPSVATRAVSWRMPARTAAL